MGPGGGQVNGPHSFQASRPCQLSGMPGASFQFGALDALPREEASTSRSHVGYVDRVGGALLGAQGKLIVPKRDV